jgi:hypothetical protein
MLALSPPSPRILTIWQTCGKLLFSELSTSLQRVGVSRPMWRKDEQASAPIPCGLVRIRSEFLSATKAIATSTNVKGPHPPGPLSRLLPADCRLGGA